MYRPNRLKARLAAGEKSLGPWLQSASPVFAEMASVAGFDFIIMDQEHGAGDLAAAVETMRAASAGPATVIVRVPSSDPTFIRRLVDAGVEGILVPMVETAAQARAIVDCCKYPPRGSRGNAWDITLASSYGFDASYLEGADDNLLVIVQIETALAVRNAAEIAAVEGVDVVFIGPTDLSGSIGLPGQTGAPEVEALIAQAAAAARAAGKPLAGVPRVGRTWQQILDDGFAMVANGSEIFFYRQAISAMLQEYRGTEATGPRTGYSS
jgi:4-hydroxy-2-oxoheptanedioate aldolase